MSTQYSTDVPISASHNQRAFKLLELPPDLLAALESDIPPKIIIKSSATIAASQEHAVLCFGDKKYQMRQKNSSNPIMILEPSSSQRDGGDEETFVPQPSVTAISKIEDTIELILIEEQPKAAPKVNKWHEKFAKSRPPKKE